MLRKTQTYLKGGIIIIMLKKVMIICLAFSFVFIGGIAFGVDGEPGALQEQEGQEISSESAHSSGDVIPAEPTDLITSDEPNDEGDELKQGQQPEEAEEDGNGRN